MNPLVIHSLLQFSLTSWCNGLFTLPKEIFEYGWYFISSSTGFKTFAILTSKNSYRMF